MLYQSSSGKYASLIAEHARAMKLVDPTLKAFWNDNGPSTPPLRVLIAQCFVFICLSVRIMYVTLNGT